MPITCSHKKSYGQMWLQCADRIHYCKCEIFAGGNVMCAICYRQERSWNLASFVSDEAHIRNMVSHGKCFTKEFVKKARLYADWQDALKLAKWLVKAGIPVEILPRKPKGAKTNA